MIYFVEPSAVVDEGSRIGKGTKIWHFTHIMSGCVIGENCVIGQNVFVAATVQIGNNVKVQNNVSLYDGIICEDNVFIGPSVVFTNIINPRSFINKKKEFQKTLIKQGASIGANATILCGNEIGEYAMIGAGTVITKSVLPYALVVGNPGVQIGWISEYGNRLNFNVDGIAICEATGQKYNLVDNIVNKY